MYHLKVLSSCFASKVILSSLFCLEILSLRRRRRRYPASASYPDRRAWGTWVGGGPGAGDWGVAGGVASPRGSG